MLLNLFFCTSSFVFFFSLAIVLIFLRVRGRRDRMQSVPITTKGVSSNPVHGEVHSIQHYVIQVCQ